MTFLFKGAEMQGPEYTNYKESLWIIDFTIMPHYVL